MLVYKRTPFWLDALENSTSAAQKAKNYNLPAANIIERNDDFLIEMALPGFDKKDIVIDIEANQLKISSKKEITRKENDVILKSEFTPGSFERKFELPETVDSDRIEASLKSGLLHVTIPKMEFAKAKPPREIAIA